MSKTSPQQTQRKVTLLGHMTVDLHPQDPLGYVLYMGSQSLEVIEDAHRALHKSNHTTCDLNDRV